MKLIRLTESQLYELIEQTIITEMGRVAKPIAPNEYSPAEKKSILETFRDILREYSFSKEYVKLDLRKNYLTNDIPLTTNMWKIFEACVERDIEKRKELMGGFTERKRDAAIRIMAKYLDLPTSDIEILWKVGLNEMLKQMKAHNFSINKRDYKQKGFLR